MLFFSSVLDSLLLFYSIVLQMKMLIHSKIQHKQKPRIFKKPEETDHYIVIVLDTGVKYVANIISVNLKKRVGKLHINPFLLFYMDIMPHNEILSRQSTQIS